MVRNQVKLPGFPWKRNEIYSFRSFNCWISPVGTCGGVTTGVPHVEMGAYCGSLASPIPDSRVPRLEPS
jgi:hypothetical protein